MYACTCTKKKIKRERKREGGHAKVKGERAGPPSFHFTLACFCRHEGVRWCLQPRPRDPPACGSGKMSFPWRGLGHCRTLSLCNALHPSSQTLQSSPHLHREGKMSHKKKIQRSIRKDIRIFPPPLTPSSPRPPPRVPLGPVVVCRPRCVLWVNASPSTTVQNDQSGPS